METAPFYTDLAKGPENGAAYWVHAQDGVRLRLGVWPGFGETPHGTVFIFPGRTEYLEKYALNAGDLNEAGFCVTAIDWRGQGLANRVAHDRMLGHVNAFSDYQLDVAAMFAAVEELDLPKPWFVLGHSMGGCIALRALIEGLDISAVAFSAPMFGIKMTPLTRCFAWAASSVCQPLGLCERYTPSTLPQAYVLSEPFETNKLTTDRDMYEHMISQVLAKPELQLGGPSLRWLHQGLLETRALSKLPSPNLPCLMFLGSDEDIVDPARIQQRARKWPGALLDQTEGARHELLMEDDATRTRITNCLVKFFTSFEGLRASDLRSEFVHPSLQSEAPSRPLRRETV